MTVVGEMHSKHGATFVDRGGRRVVAQYGRPDRTHRAVRNGVGVVEPAYGVLAVTGEDRHDYVDNVVSNRVPATDGRGCYALLLDPQGRIETDLYVYTASERILVFTPPDRAEPLAEEWREKVFIQDVDIDVATDSFGVFGVHGPNATEKIASVLNGAASPDEHLTFVRGTIHDEGVTVVRGDGLAGEEGYEVICGADAAEPVFDTLLNHGLNAVPFGYRTWQSLTLEAGTPLYETELQGSIPNAVGVRNGLDFEKGCYIGQEVVSRIENRGRPPGRLIGLAVEDLPEPGAAVFAGDAAVGEVTRAVESPTREEPIAFARVDFGVVDVDRGEGAADPADGSGNLADGSADTNAGPADLVVRVGGEEVAAQVVELPFVDGSDRSARLPSYP